MDAKYLLSDNPQVVAMALKRAIEADRSSKAKEKAREGQRYYDYQHDILNNRIFYIDDNDIMKEDKNAANAKIPHAFFTEQVDQKVQYLLSNPVEVVVEDEEFQKHLEEYYDEDMQLFLQEALEGASKKGFEYAYARTNVENRLEFQVSDSIQTFSVYDGNGIARRTIRYYNKDIYRDGKNVSIEHAEVWDDKETLFFVENKAQRFELDAARELNPRPHVVAKRNDGQLLKRSLNTIPFYRFSNNKGELTDLQPIKELIDDYDIMACYLSNNLQDMSEAIYVVKGFVGDDLSKVRQNIRAKKVAGVKTDGDVDIKTVEIPFEARKTKLEIDKDAIYKFGMAVDTSQIGHSNGTVTNVAIKSGYALLDMKANKAEVRLRAMLKWINQLIVDDINRRFNKNYDAKDIDIEIVRTTPVNENDIAENERIKAETRLVIIQTILAAAPRIGEEETLKLICEQFELDFEEIKLMIEEQEFTSGLQDDTDPIEDDEDEAGQVE